ncbi:MAG TPA: hypothetical protein PK914_07700 [Smithellaceae bacterium]|nr:hypothetical protein [Smithellaceae bacterium]
MKKFMILFALLIIAFGAFADTIVVHDTIYASPAVLDPNQIPVGGGWSDWVGWVFGVVVVFIVQVILKVVPTWRSYDLFRWISTFTALIAKIFNGVGDAAKTDNGKKAVFKNTKVTLEK